MAYEELFHTMVVESQGSSYAERNPDAPAQATYLAIGERHGMLGGITLCLDIMSQAGHIDRAIYDEWRNFRYSREMDDPEMFRKVIIQQRSERE